MTGETIAALATARGTAALAVVRLSGPDAIPIVSGLFRPADRLSAPASPHCAIGQIFDGEEPVDRVVVWLYRAPRSYTGEDVVEIGCHGGCYASGRILQLLFRAGARPAREGEFTLRAFLNRKLDLAQAEAVEALIAARSAAAARAAARVLDGCLRRTLAESVDRLSEALALIEATLDIQEDGAPDTLSPLWEPRHPSGGRIADILDRECEVLERLLQGGRTGQMLEEGLRVVLAGRSNAGKSSLFNALLARERAIVAPEPGTTRDFLEGWVEWDGLPIALVDTAGLQDATTPLEQEGIRRAREALASATLVVQVVDVKATSAGEAAADAKQLGVPPERVVVALHKWDLGAGPDWAESASRGLGGGVCEATGEAAAPWSPAVPSSVVAEPGVEPLRRVLLDRLHAGIGDPEATLLVGERQRQTLARAHEALVGARDLLARGYGGELVAFELKQALERVGEVLGRAVGPLVLDQVFSRFCVGK